MARDLASGVGRKAGENASVVPDEASVDLANPGPDANAGIPLTVRLAFGAPNGSIALCQCLINVDQLTSLRLAGSSLKCQLPTSGEPPLTTAAEPLEIIESG